MRFTLFEHKVAYIYIVQYSTLLADKAKEVDKEEGRRRRRKWKNQKKKKEEERRQWANVERFQTKVNHSRAYFYIGVLFIGSSCVSAMKIYQRIYPGCADDVETEIVHLYPTEIPLLNYTTTQSSISSFLVLVVNVVPSSIVVVFIVTHTR